MKRIALLILLCCLLSPSFTNAQHWCWVTDTNISEAGAHQSAATDLYGNMYNYTDGKKLLKHKTSDGSTKWMKTIPGGWFNLTRLATDFPGNLYVLYDSTAGLESKLMKLDSSGTMIWSRTISWLSGTFWDRPISISIDDLGHLYACSAFRTSGHAAGTDTLWNTASYKNSLIAKYDTSGTLKWLKAVSSPAYATVGGVANDASGNLFICGLCKSDTLTILDTTVNLALGPAAEIIFVAKCDSNGHLLWINANRRGVAVGTTLFGVPAYGLLHIGVDGAGNAYVTGRYRSTDTLGTLPITYTSNNQRFVAKYRGSDGAALWAKTGGSTKAEYGSFCTNQRGMSFVIFSTGDSLSAHFGVTPFTVFPGTSNNSLIVGFDSSGNVVCGYMLGGDSAEDDIGVSIDVQGNAYIYGDYIGVTVFGGITKWSPSAERYFVGKYTCACLCDSSITIDGGNILCVGGTTTLSLSSASGGTWTSSNPSVATITPTGIVTAVSTGSTIIGYMTGGGCNGTAIVTVISGPTLTIPPICVGAAVTLSASTGAGTWGISTSGSATIFPATGVTICYTAGPALISYSNGAGCNASYATTVMPTPTITGSTVCAGSTTTLTTAIPGGTWSGGSTSVAIVAPSTGVVTGISAGTVVITCTATTGCVDTTIVTVSPFIPPTTVMLCGGATTTLTGSTPGGTWASSNPLVATVGSSTGIVNAIASGATVISYIGSSACPEVANITVNATGSIGGKFSVCEGASTMLSCTPSGGIWSSGSPAIATVSASGFLTGIIVGTATITYMSFGGCFSTAIVTVNALPTPIAGPTTVALGNTITLTDATSGGAWSSGDSTKALPNTAGVITGVTPGTATIYYTLPTGCKQSVVITVTSKNTTVVGAVKIPKPSLYPNPATNEIIITTAVSGFESFSIYNSTGQVMLTHNITHTQTTVNVKTYPAGEYKVIFNGNGLRETVRFVKW